MKNNIDTTAIDTVRAALYDGDDTIIDLSGLFSQESWESGSGPLDADTLEALDLEDVTSDGRWQGKFEGGHRLGAYLDDRGNYWTADLDGDRPKLFLAGSSLDAFLATLGIEAQD